MTLHSADRDDDVAAGATCPLPECGALVVAYRAADGTGRDNTHLWKFMCQRCGFEFEVPKEKLIFQPVPRKWLLANAGQA